MQRDGVGPPRRVRWQPAGGRLDVRRPTRVRLLLVNGLITSGLWLAAWRYVIDGRGATDRKSTRLNSSHLARSRMPSSA